MECNQSVAKEINTKDNKKNRLVQVLWGKGTKEFLHWLLSGLLLSFMPIIFLFMISYVAYGHIDFLDNASDYMIAVVSVGATVFIGISDYTEAYKKNAFILMFISMLVISGGAVVYAISVLKLVTNLGVPQRVIHFASFFLLVNIVLEMVVAMFINYHSNKEGGKQNG